ncbi:MAG: carbohydrate binding family 9 domain-containing protein [Acidobacteria bacterium]|nr:carbohydrate binding family 9 domain-containing protein [Acidobacteriota bacterium]
MRARVIVFLASLGCSWWPASALGVQAAGADASAVRPVDNEKMSRPTGYAAPVTSPVVVDGHLREAAWEQAPEITNFVQSMPKAGAAATERTVVRVLYDDKRLYIGAICYDSKPTEVVIKTLERDLPGLSTHELDIFGVYLDTFLDRRNAFLWLINPRGAYRDGQSFNDSRSLDFGWDGIADIKTQITEIGWTLEMAIPWTTLRFDPTRKEQTWGANFMRRVRRLNEESAWAPLDRRDRPHRMSKAGTLEKLEATRPGRNLGFKPFALARSSSGAALATADRGTSFDGGLDFKYGITPRMTIDLTYRTDFSHVEVDREQVNLTRFPLFFPELRDFFIENSGTFQFGDVAERNYRTGSSTRDFTLFHSRQVGLNRGRPVPVVGGGRLTGHAGDFEVGLLNVQTEAFENDPAENFMVLRLRRNIGASDIGVLFGNRQATGALSDQRYNRSFGADANVKLFDNLIVNSYAAFTQVPGISGDNKAARLAVGWRDKLWDTTAFVRHIGDAFTPGIGFVQRTNIRHYYATFGAHPQPRIPKILEVNPYVEGHYITNLRKGFVETRTATGGFDVSFLDGGILRLEYNDRFERLERPFPVRSDVVIPVGSYAYREATAGYSSNAARPLSGTAEVSGGGYYDGHRNTIGGSVLWEVNYHLSFNVSATHNAISAQGRSFSADVYAVRAKYAPTTRLFFGAYVQYNAATDQLVTNLRTNFIHAPLSDLFVVYTERRDATGKGIQERLVTVKLTKWLQF